MTRRAFAGRQGSAVARRLGCLIVLLTSIGPLAAPAGASADWTTYMQDNARNGYTSSSVLPASAVHTLALRWTAKAGDTISAQAIAANGVIYWGSWDGLEHATNPRTGKDRWRTYLGAETKSDCIPPHLGVASTATTASLTIAGHRTSVLFVGGGDGAYYALNARTGKVIWSHSFGSPAQGEFSWSSPAFYKGSVYIGLASIGDCPLTPGAVVKLNATDGSQLADYQTVPFGCLGAGVWSSPTIDEATGDVYVSTGTDGGGLCGQLEPESQAVVQLTGDLSLVGAWKIPIPEEVPDGDFGGTPTLFNATIGGVAKELVGVANKNGVYYAFDRASVGAGPVWKTAQISSQDNTIASSAWDGSRLYVAGNGTEIGGRACEGSIRAVDPSTGAFIWSDCLAGGVADAALTAIKGAVFAPLGSILYGLSTTVGKILFEFKDPSAHWFYSPAMVTGKALYIGNSSGSFYKFTPRGR
jgi:outer membrane protein assembly factor BamB